MEGHQSRLAGTPAAEVPAQGARDWDGIGLEILRSALVGICEEMLATLIRSGRSPSLRERRDCSASVYAPTGEMVVQAEHIPVHLGVMPHALRKILEAFPVAGLRPGDCFVTNDPYLGMSNHLPDLIVGGPLFIDNTLAGFACSMAHHNDVGGMAPRSMSAEATEIFQEGMRLPPLQVASAGALRQDVLATIAANSRMPADIANDVRAQIAAVALAQRRLNQMTIYSDTTHYLKGLVALLDRSEAAMRSRINSLPDGTWHGRSCAEDGLHEFPIEVRVRIDGSELFIDFAGTAEQSASPYNATLANTYATVMTFVRTICGRGVPASAGAYRPLHVSIPDGTIINPHFPAAVAATTQVSYHSYEALMRAWECVDPNAVIADSGAGGVYSWGGRNPRTGHLYAYGEALGGGSGAGATMDGQDAVMPPIANLRDTPTEALEVDLPVRVERYQLLRGSEGEGRFRGGRGFRRVVRMLAPAVWSVQISMSKRPPQGIGGGGAGGLTRCRVVRASGAVETITRFATVAVAAGDAVVIETAGGGGYGPTSRELSNVLTEPNRDLPPHTETSAGTREG